MLERIIRFTVSRPRFVVALSVALVAVLAWNIRRLEIDPNIRNMLPHDMPEWVNLADFEATFGSSDILLVSVTTDDLLDAEMLQKLHGLHRSLVQVSHVSRVLSIFEMKYLEASERSFRPVDLIDPDHPPASPEEKAAIEHRIRSETLFTGTLVSEDLRHCSFIVLPDEGFEDQPLVDAVEGAVDASGLEAAVVGLPKTRIAVTGGMQGDLKLFLPLGIVAMIILLVLSFWSWLGAILPLIVVVMSILATFGLMGLIGEKVSFISIVLPVMLIAIANDYSIHLVSHYMQRSGVPEGTDRRVQAWLATRSLTIPVLAAGLTTVVGFLTLGTHVIPAARVMGVLAAFGIVVAFVLSLTFVPAMLSLLPEPLQALERFRVGPLGALLDRTSGFVQRRGVLLLVLAVALGAAAATGIPHIVVDTDPIHYFHEKAPLRLEQEHVNGVFGGSVQMNVVVEGDIQDPAVLGRMEALERFLEGRELVTQVTSVVQPVKRMNQAFHANDPAWYRLPEDRRVVGDFLLLYSMGSDPSDFDHLVELDYTRAQVAARVASTSSTRARALVLETEDYIAAAGDSALFPTVTGFVTVLGVLVDLIVRGQLISLGMSLALIMLITMAVYRSLVAGLVVTIPLILAMLTVFGLMGAMGIELNIATVMLSSVLIGVGVDYSLHFLWHFREGLAREPDPWEAYRRTLNSSGRGIIVNALSVIVGFVVMLFSTFLPIYFLGFLLTVSIAVCLVAALVVLPVLCILIRPRFLFDAGIRARRLRSGQEAPEPRVLETPDPRWMRAVTKACAVLGLAGVAWGAWLLVQAVCRFYGDLDTATSWGTATLEVLGRNWGIAVAVYVMICLNAAGVAELRFR
ncbi:MAG: RND family transporter, partial [Deltaproteobacteria bacterium]|nr:RND family transporter [Deltaproteobacteria bacterium]